VGDKNKENRTHLKALAPFPHAPILQLAFNTIDKAAKDHK
jgi:hypothetical protein